MWTSVRWMWPLMICAVAGCAADEGANSRAGSRGQAQSGNGAGGSLADDDFGNAPAVQPPLPATDPKVTGGSCKPGHYVGTFTGLYSSPAAAEFPIPVAAVDLPDPAGGPALPGFEFWLESSQEPCDVGEEFCFDYTVEGGKIRGQANGLFPFEIDLQGALDCDKGVFKGELRNGHYLVGIFEFMFEGTMDASYDASASQFFDGVWEVKEPMGVNAGGFGEWHAGWVMD